MKWNFPMWTVCEDAGFLRPRPTRVIPSAEAASFGVSVWKKRWHMSMRRGRRCLYGNDFLYFFVTCPFSPFAMSYAPSACGFVGLFARIAANSYQFVMACAVIFLLVLDSTTAATPTRFERNSVIWWREATGDATRLAGHGDHKCILVQRACQHLRS